jgi:hypothetical protein
MPLRILLNNCVCNMYINKLFLKFSVITVTIYFIVLNVSVEFVLIYCPHLVFKKGLSSVPVLQYYRVP